jgi:hypothetical protein
VRKSPEEGRISAWIWWRIFASFCFPEKCLGDARDGWTPGMDQVGEQQLCSSLDKMLTVWNHIKGRDVEESVHGLVQIQSVL